MRYASGTANQTMQLTATRQAFAFSMTKLSPLQFSLAPADLGALRVEALLFVPAMAIGMLLPQRFFEADR